MNLLKTYMEAAKNNAALFSNKKVSLYVHIDKKVQVFNDTIKNLKETIEGLFDEQAIDDDTYIHAMDNIIDKEEELKEELADTQKFKNYVINKTKGKTTKSKDKFVSELLDKELIELEKLIK